MSLTLDRDPDAASTSTVSNTQVTDTETSSSSSSIATSLFGSVITRLFGNQPSLCGGTNLVNTTEISEYQAVPTDSFDGEDENCDSSDGEGENESECDSSDGEDESESQSEELADEDAFEPQSDEEDGVNSSVAVISPGELLESTLYPGASIASPGSSTETSSACGQSADERQSLMRN